MKISVIIPCYNSAQWVGAAVRSVLAQTRAPEEILVVDDGSTDDPEAALREFGGKVRLLRRENGGLSAARNTGVEAAGGDWFLFLDADDSLFPDALERLGATAESSGAGVAYGLVLQRNAEGGKLHSLARAAGAPPVPAKAAFWWTPLATAGCALIRRELNEAVGGFDENFRQVEDAEYWLRCGVTAPFAHTDTMVLDKAYHGESLGQRRGSSIWYRLQLQRKFLDWCAVRGIDTGFLQTTPARMVDHALIQAWRAQTWPLLRPLLGQARSMGVFTSWCAKAWMKVLAMNVTGQTPATPDFCREVWSAWRDEAQPATPSCAQ
ncbi:MAG: glycosyltransferase family 2 protein [Chthoniobacterales bacterium]|nr:glycosyltransferase family 2 protein [Chthoniobacterales bacterium]